MRAEFLVRPDGRSGLAKKTRKAETPIVAAGAKAAGARRKRRRGRCGRAGPKPDYRTAGLKAPGTAVAEIVRSPPRTLPARSALWPCIGRPSRRTGNVTETSRWRAHHLICKNLKKRDRTKELTTSGSDQSKKFGHHRCAEKDLFAPVALRKINPPLALVRWGSILIGW